MRSIMLSKLPSEATDVQMESGSVFSDSETILPDARRIGAKAAFTGATAHSLDLYRRLFI
jgi:hypothetical protein